MTYLFIGGCADGSRIAVPDNMDRYCVPKVIPLRHSRTGNYDEYRAEKFAANNLVIRVFVEKHLEIQTALQMMVDNYQAKESVQA